MPEVEKLGNIHKEKKNVVIAKMNSINNEVPGLPVFDVPTIVLFVKGSRNVGPFLFHSDFSTNSSKITKIGFPTFTPTNLFAKL